MYGIQQTFTPSQYHCRKHQGFCGMSQPATAGAATNGAAIRGAGISRTAAVSVTTLTPKRGTAAGLCLR